MASLSLFSIQKVDKKIEKRTIVEAKKCLKSGIEIDSIVVSDEKELLEYVIQLEKELKEKPITLTRKYGPCFSH